MRLPESHPKCGSATLIDLSPSLFEAIPAIDRAVAREIRLPTLSLSPGLWRPPAIRPLLGLLIAEGIAFRSVSAGGFAIGDLVGAGDVVPMHAQPPELPWGGEATIAWQVIQPLTAGVLDVRFVACIARWPALACSLVEHQAEHADRTMARLTLAHRQRVDERVLLVLWELAERWGKVTANGVLLPIPLRHHHLAALVASLRPAVTLALGRLARLQLVERGPRGYLLHETLEEAWSRLGSAPELWRWRSTGRSPQAGPIPQRPYTAGLIHQ